MPSLAESGLYLSLAHRIHHPRGFVSPFSSSGLELAMLKLCPY